MTGVLVDLQGAQNLAHGERGIPRYLTSLALELEQRHPQLVASFLLNPDLPTPAAVERLAASGRLGSVYRARSQDASALHIGSLIELELDLERLWPAELRNLPVVVTLYDLIPEVFADHYLAHPRIRRWYRTRLQLLRLADRVLAISEATARDAVQRLGLAGDRVVAVGAGVSDQFQPPARHQEAVEAVVGRLPSVRPGFVLYTGGIEYRKNIDRLLVAYSSLIKRLRDDHQLVIVCRVAPAMRRALEARLSELGLSQHVLFPGVVADDDLVLLYQAAELFVFPSLYEGFGLPVAEAMACGTPVIAARTSSLVELVDDEDALFDPSEPRAIAAALRNALEDSDLRERLRERGLDRRWSWSEVADRTAEVYEELTRVRSRRAPRSRRARIAFVSPLPPQLSGVSDYSYRLLAELTKLVDVDVFTDPRYGAAEAPSGLPVRSIGALERVERARGGYDEVIACLGNSDHHVEALALLRRRPSAVLAHDVRLTELYAWLSRRPELEPRSFHRVLHELYPGQLPPELGERGRLDFAECERYGVLMAREAIARSTRFLVHSAHAAELARRDADPRDVAKIGVVPFGYPDPRELEVGPSDEALVATFGVVAAVKQTDLIVAAFALMAARHPDARLAIVGPASGEEQRRVRGSAERLGVAGRMVMTGALPPDEFSRWLERATVAVQLRATSNGETSASLADCLAAGIPTIATALGSTRELPEDAYVAVGPDVSTTDLAAEIEALLADPAKRTGLSSNGRRYARANSFAHVAQTLVEELLGHLPATRRAA